MSGRKWLSPNDLRKKLDAKVRVPSRSSESLIGLQKTCSYQNAEDQRKQSSENVQVSWILHPIDSIGGSDRNGHDSPEPGPSSQSPRRSWTNKPAGGTVGNQYVPPPTNLGPTPSMNHPSSTQAQNASGNQPKQSSQDSLNVSRPKSKMGDDISMKLIQLVREVPYLYTVEHPFYKNQQEKGIAWNNIADKLGTDVSICLSKWKSLRTKNLRKRKELNELGSVDEDTKRFIDSMSFVPIRKRLSVLDPTVFPKTRAVCRSAGSVIRIIEIS